MLWSLSIYGRILGCCLEYPAIHKYWVGTFLAIFSEFLRRRMYS
jgi:hypothetical protein